MKHKILIVEDDADLRRALGARLSGHGYEIVAAADGASAVAIGVTRGRGASPTIARANSYQVVVPPDDRW